MRLVIEFDWHDKGVVSLSPEGRLAIPQVPVAPGIYRFRVADASGTEVYIGESQNLRHRMLRNYASTHRGHTTVRVRELLFRYLVEKRSVRLAIVDRALLEVAGEQTSADMNEKCVRLLVENAALMLARRAGEHLHNL